MIRLNLPLHLFSDHHLKSIPYETQDSTKLRMAAGMNER
jgi:hypothetical protein